MLCALIMAGGKGTRFWPLSTEERPKQFLNLIGEDTMIQMTVKRIEKLIPLERIFICTGARYVSLVKEQLPELPDRNIIIEPESRNTAPCIALSALIINRYYKDAKMVVLPSDHLISKETKFLNILKDANDFLNNYPEAIITLGMTPNRPETGYGYIKYSKNKIRVNKNSIIKVDSFVEKPNLEKAEEYIENGCYLWNGGMFMWGTDYILEEIKRYLPGTYEALNKIEELDEDKVWPYIEEHYKETDSTSIDYGILEKAKDIFVIPSDIEWDDIGTWTSMERYREKDEFGNIEIGDVIQLNASNNMVISSGKKIIINDLEDIYVIETEDNIIIGRKENINDIKNIKESVGL